METKQTMELDRGILTMSLDFELMWGRLDKADWRNFEPICHTVREEVVGRLLELFHEYRISASWCTVGRMFLNKEEAFARTTPGADRLAMADVADPEAVLYGCDLVRMVQNCATEQEIGCHTFSHVNFAACSRARAEAELAACVRAARAMGVDLKSFVFPRNRVGHLDLLPKYGFRIFRGPDPVWHEEARVRSWKHRAGHLADVARAAAPPVVLPEWNENGLWDIKGSMLYTPSYGFRQHIPVSRRVNRAVKGLHAAAHQRRIFHLWFHPSDVVVRQDAMLDGLRQIFDEAAAMQTAGELEILPMCDIPSRITQAQEVLAPAYACCA